MTIAALILLAIAVAFGWLAWNLFQCGLRAPDVVIGKPGSPYLRRWWVIPRNRVLNVYLHQILRSDDDRALHDHPWTNVSILLKGSYREALPVSRPSNDWPCPPIYAPLREAGSIVFRRPTSAHRLIIETDEPCWSLFVTGPNVRTWGFWCPRGWKPWRDFVDPHDPGAIGPGCGER